ncbi:MAG TPA: hypothetical protein VE981_23145 [Planctomycetota bacterium]|nr:hypothetical protein [Planctomycetota bacterium]
MGHEIVYCTRCQSRLTSADFDRGSGVRISNYIYCFTCLTEHERTLVDKAKKASSSAAVPRISGSSSRAVPTVPGMPGTARKPAPAPKPVPVVVWAGFGAGVLVVIGLLWALMAKGGSRPPEAEAAPRRPQVIAVPPAAPPKDFKPELDALRTEMTEPLNRGNFRMGQAILDRARPAHPEDAWTQAVDGLGRDVQTRARARFQELKESSARAVERKDVEELRTARAEIAGWGPAFQPLLREFEAAFGAALSAAANPQPVAPSPADPAPPMPPNPPLRSESAKKYDAAWEKAMTAAARREDARALAELRAAGRDVAEEELKKANAKDVKTLERLPALRAELAKAAAGLNSWEEVALDVIQEDGSRAAVKSTVLKATAQRLELRGEPRMVEIDDIAPASLATLYVRKRGKPSPEDAAALDLLCALDGAGSAEMPERLRNLAESVKGRPVEANPAKKTEWAAKKLYYEADKEFQAPETRAAALEKYGRLLSAYADTAFIRVSRGDISTRMQETREYVFSAARMSGKGIFSLQKVQVVLGKEKVEMSGWRSKDEPTADDAASAVEVGFFAPAAVDYRAWALVGGCCATTFTWYLQANELAYVDKKTRKTLACDPGGNFAAPWEHRVKSLSTTHGGKNHAKADKEPAIWEWIELPALKFTTPGLKTIRFLPGSKGEAMAAVLVSAERDKPPPVEELKKISELAADEAVPTSALKVGKGEPDLLSQIPEARSYILVYDLDLSKLRKPVQYDADHRAEVKRPFDRIGYAVELQKSGGPMQYVFVSMDAFTDDVGKIGIPDVASGARFQQKVTSMNIHSNVEGVTTGIRVDGGNIEFWPNNYAPQNQAGIPGASDGAFDFGDAITQPVDGYGSMQVHHFKSGQTIFAINDWGAGNGAEMGIGNSKTGNPDYTFTKNAGSYSYKRLRVLVHPR